MLNELGVARWFRPLRRNGPFWRRLASWGAAHVPRAMLRLTPPLWGIGFALALPDARRVVRSNLRTMLGARSSWRELRDVFATFAHFASAFAESLTLGSGRELPLEREVTGEAHLQAALAPRRGAILLTVHSGAWETVGPLLAKAHGLEMVIAMQSESDIEARRIQDEVRARAGVRVVHVGAEPLSVLPLYSHLRRGGGVGFQVDRVPADMRAIPVTLWGEPGRLPAGPFHLARATGAPLIPIFSKRIGFFRYRIEVSEPIWLDRDTQPDEIARAAQKVAASMETFLRASPTHWFNFGSLQLPG